MPRLLPTLSSRAEGAVLGLAAGRSLAAGAGPDGGLALALIVAEELGAGRTDLRRVAGRWVERHRSDGRGIDQETAGALRHIARHDAPPRQGTGRSAEALIRCIPVALAMSHSPHIAALTHPDPAVTWSAVALNVALARSLLGSGISSPMYWRRSATIRCPPSSSPLCAGCRSSGGKSWKRRNFLPRMPSDV